MSQSTEATPQTGSQSDPVPTPASTPAVPSVPDPIELIDQDGDLVMNNEPDWDTLEGDALTEYLQDMHKVNKQLLVLLNKKTKPVINKKEDGDIMKLKRPGPFDGSSEKLRPFVAELRYYIRNFPRTLRKEEAKVAFAATCLEGVAKNWFQPFWEDHENNGPEGTESADTIQMYKSMDHFEKQLVKMFLDMGEQRALENKLAKLTQNGKCATYVVKFNEIASRLGWDAKPLKKMFYDGLKFEVKEKVNEYRREDIPLVNFQQRAVDQDNLLYELRIEKNQKNYKPQEKSNQGKKRYEPIAKDNSGNPGPMDLSMMQKGNKKKEFKCYNCGKANHMARDCKSPKKERSQIPEPPKNNFVLSKDDKTIHLLERSGSPENNDDYEFYHSEPELSDESETLAEESDNGIPDRQPVPQRVSFRWINEYIGNLQQTDVTNDDWRNHGKHHVNHDDVWKTHDNYTPDLRTLNMFHHNLVEAERPGEIYTTRCFYDWLDTVRQPTPRNHHIIRATTIDQALQLSLNYQQAIGEHEHIDPEHPEHYRISWTDCITHRCMEHFQQKMKVNTFPLRIPFKAILYPHNSTQFIGWEPTQRYRTLKTIVLEPLECEDRTSLYGCTKHHCKVHKLEKLLDWQKSNQERREKQNCQHDQENWKDCDVIECPKHAENKIRNWHTISKNYESPL